MPQIRPPALRQTKRMTDTSLTCPGVSQDDSTWDGEVRSDEDGDRRSAYAIERIRPHGNAQRPTGLMIKEQPK